MRGRDYGSVFVHYKPVGWSWQPEDIIAAVTPDWHEPSVSRERVCMACRLVATTTASKLSSPLPAKTTRGPLGGPNPPAIISLLIKQIYYLIKEMF